MQPSIHLGHFDQPRCYMVTLLFDLYLLLSSLITYITGYNDDHTQSIDIHSGLHMNLKVHDLIALFQF